MTVTILESKQIFTDLLLSVDQRLGVGVTGSSNPQTPAQSGQTATQSAGGRTGGGLLGANLGHNFLQPAQNQPTSPTTSSQAKVYFYRCIGFESKETQLGNLMELNQKLEAMGHMYVRLEGRIPQPYNMALTEKLSKLLETMTQQDIRGNRLIALLDGAGTFAVTRDAQTNEAFRDAFSEIMQLYCVNEPRPNMSIEKNFIIKLVLWASEYVPKMFNNRIAGLVPKIMYVGQLKKHETYFLILMSQLGSDVLYVNGEDDGDYLKVDPYNKYSKLLQLPIRQPLEIVFNQSTKQAAPASTSMSTPQRAQEQPARSGLLDLTRPGQQASSAQSAQMQTQTQSQAQQPARSGLLDLTRHGQQTSTSTSPMSQVPAQPVQPQATAQQPQRSGLLDLTRPSQRTQQTQSQPQPQAQQQQQQSTSTQSRTGAGLLQTNPSAGFGQNAGAKLVDKDRVVTTLKKAVDIFEDITFPLEKRVGYVGLPSPVLPVYFYRAIGIDDKDLNSEDEYYNRIYTLDKRLSSAGGYVRFVDHIPAPDNLEIEQITKRYATIFQSSQAGLGAPGNFDARQLVNKIKSAGVLKNCRDRLYDEMVNNAFEKVIGIYLQRERSINQNRLQNFIYKLVVWLNRYSIQLKLGNGVSDSPKILYYGDIKAHEIYFLIMLSNMGCDILYLTTDDAKDKAFVEVDPGEEYTTILVYPKILPMQDFPDKERTIRKTTTAFTASRELEEIIFNGEVGLFKPWQFEAYSTKPVTLRTTYDEFKILWQEDAKIRPEFKVENGSVYVPNLFAKIGGTLESLEQYWQDYKYLTKQPNTLEIKNVPFTATHISKQEVYSLAYLLDSKGQVNMEQLQSSKHYKFGYLRTSLQRLMINKLNELMSYEGFKRPMDNNLRLQILATVITMDDSMLKLIETFDYPWGVPKLVIYNNAKESFSDEDAIILAYLNSIGLDIAILTPTNYNTIEQKLKEDLFDRFQLPSIQYDLQVPHYIGDTVEKGKSIFSRIFG